MTHVMRSYCSLYCAAYFLLKSSAGTIGYMLQVILAVIYFIEDAEGGCYAIKNMCQDNDWGDFPSLSIPYTKHDVRGNPFKSSLHSLKCCLSAWLLHHLIDDGTFLYGCMSVPSF
ncbi:hypothetical protein AB205_0065810 [Aquarana catesbeiana]|uniref:Uncharacterized protein n=1 Tax=Aquarana catesbeiana TaxID=8400 RepID=A0A2G9NAW7_AQUCT|nr:hypothetical protein AB205_0065810 [Aquarana catesbeiana]